MWTIAFATLLLAGPAPAEDAAKAAPPPPPVEREWGAPPAAASAEDQRLWRDLKDGTAGATLHLARLAQCGYRIRYGRYHEALDERRGDARASAAREELSGATRAAQAVVPERPGVYPCRHVLLDLDQRIEEPSGFADVDEVRREARDCASSMKRLVAAVEPAADRLEAALTRADEALGRTPPAPPSGGKGPGADDAGAALRESVR
jgi:hypothetical protein